MLFYCISHNENDHWSLVCFKKKKKKKFNKTHFGFICKGAVKYKKSLSRVILFRKFGEKMNTRKNHFPFANE